MEALRCALRATSCPDKHERKNVGMLTGSILAVWRGLYMLNAMGLEELSFRLPTQLWRSGL